MIGFLGEDADDQTLSQSLLVYPEALVYVEACIFFEPCEIVIEDLLIAKRMSLLAWLRLACGLVGVCK